MALARIEMSSALIVDLSAKTAIQSMLRPRPIAFVSFAIVVRTSPGNEEKRKNENRFARRGSVIK